MKKVITILMSVLFVFSVAGLSFAASQNADPAEKAATKTVKKKHIVKVKQVTGEVTAVDAKANTLTVKAKKGEVALTTDEKTKVSIGKEKNKSLDDVKVGDKVTAKYTEADGKNVAKSVAVRVAPKAKKHTKKAAPKAEEKPAAK